MKVYTVTAYRYGNREQHSYIVSVRSTSEAALMDVEIEEDYRGGKYQCEVLEWELDESLAGSFDGFDINKEIKSLPTIRKWAAST